jgi:hypothetical protein
LKSIASPNRFKHLHVDQFDAVEQAEKQLMAAELMLFHARTKAHKVSIDDTSESSENRDARTHESGPSKGKAIDPCNFGDLDLSGSEMNPEEQHKAFALWNEVKRMRDQEKSPKKSGHVRTSPPASFVSEDFKYVEAALSPTPSDYDVVSNHIDSNVTHEQENHVFMDKRPNVESVRSKRGSKKSRKPHGSASDRHVIPSGIPKVHDLGGGKRAAKRSQSMLRPIQQLDPQSYLGKLM